MLTGIRETIRDLDIEYTRKSLVAIYSRGAMSVYVDQPIHRFRQMLMCHMLADSPEELHEMADRIGMARKWYQYDASTPHYDLPREKRAAAIAAGAVEVARRDLVAVIRRIRTSIRACPDGGAWGRDRRLAATAAAGRRSVA
jgi:hypothetical protein